MNAAEMLRAWLAWSHDAMREGDAAEGERRAKAVSALVRAEREVAEFASVLAAQSQENNEEALRAELRSRLRRFVDAAHAGAPDDVLKRIGTGEAAP